MKPFILAAALVAGCVATSSGETIHSTDIYLKYTLQDASILAAAGGPTVVYGAPASGVSAEDVVSELRMPSYLTPNKTTLVASDTEGYRLVLVFAPQAGLSGPSVCKGEAKGGVSGQAIKVLAVFCRGERSILSETRMDTSAAIAPGSPGFQSAMRRMLRELLPLRSPFDQGERGCRRGGC